MWINTRPVEVEEEILAIRCSVIYYTAIHADLISLRNGNCYIKLYLIIIIIEIYFEFLFL